MSYQRSWFNSGVDSDHTMVRASKSTSNIEIFKLDLKMLKRDCTMAFIGRRGSGKSLMAQYIMRQLRHDFDRVVVFARTMRSLKEYTRFVPELFCFNEFDTDRVRHIYAVQEADFTRGSGKRMLIVVDDFGFERKVMNSSIMKEMLMNARHAGVTIMLTLQDPVCLEGSGIRNQLDYVFLAAEKAAPIRKRLREMFSVFDPPRKFDLAFSQLTRNNSQMVIVNVEIGSQDIADNVFWYKSRVKFRPDGSAYIPRFRFAPHSDIWTFHHKHFDDGYDQRALTALDVVKVAEPEIRKVNAKNVKMLRALSKKRAKLKAKTAEEGRGKVRRKSRSSSSSHRTSKRKSSSRHHSHNSKHSRSHHKKHKHGRSRERKQPKDSDAPAHKRCVSKHGLFWAD